MKQSGVRALLMGGQACVLYGAAELSRDIDFAIVASPASEAVEGDDRRYWRPLRRELEQMRHGG